MRIGIDLTSRQAHLKTGMANVVQGYLRGLRMVAAEDSVILFVTEDNRAVYEPSTGGPISLQVTSADELQQYIDTLDVIHYPFNELCLDQSRIASVVTVHDIIPEHFPQVFPYTVREALQQTCRRATFIVADSEFTRTDIVNRYAIAPEKIRCVYGAVSQIFDHEITDVDRESVRERYGLPERFLLYPAAARPHKNHETLFNALAQVKDIDLVLTTGETHLPERFERLREQVVDSDRIHVVGHVDDADYPIFFDLAFAVVTPSLAEGYGYPVVEAHHMGVPVVASNAMSLPEIAGEGALLFDPHDEDALAAAINQLISDQVLHDRLVAAGKANSQRFSLETIGRDLLHAYKAAHDRFKDQQSTPRFTVTVDTWRLLHSARRQIRPTGITRYADILYRELLSRDQMVEVSTAVYPDVAEDDLPGLAVAVESGLLPGPTGEICWRYEEKHPRIRRFIDAVERRIPPNIRGKGRLQRLSKRLQQRHLTYSPFSTRDQWDIYHSPVNPLPPRLYTGNATRILTVHDCIYLVRPEFWGGEGVPSIRYALDSVDVQRDYILCDSYATQQDVLSLIPIAKDRTQVVHLAADTLFAHADRHYARPLLDQIGAKHYILALAQPEARKNTQGLVEAFLKLNPPDHDLVLVCASKVIGKRLQSQLEAHHLIGPSVKIVYDVDDETLAALYAGATFYAYPSLYEGFGIPILEAMMSGTPVLTSNASSMPEVGGEAVEYIDPYDVESIRTGMEKLLASTEYRASLIERGHAQASRFSWERTVDEILAYYRLVRSDNIL